MKLAVDVDQVAELSEDRERLWGAVSAADFLSVEEKREMLGFGVMKNPSPPPPSTNLRLAEPLAAPPRSPAGGEGK